MAKFSTGFRNKWLQCLSTVPAAPILAGVKMSLYSGPIPATADDSIGAATKLSTISNDATATALTFASVASDGTLTKNVSEIWRGVNAASGTASFYRIEEAADAGGLSTTLVRIQGTIAVAGADLNLSSVTLTSGASQTIDNYVVALPTL